MNDSTIRILHCLRDAEGFVSGETICREFGMTRSAVWKHISKLRALGYGIDALTGRGYRLSAMPGLPVGPEIEPLLDTSRVGRELFFYPIAVSTNALAKSFARNGAGEGAVVTADAQSGGRGRMQRVWSSPAGVNLYFSVILRPSVSPLRLPQIPLLVAAALHRALSFSVPGLQVLIKWPNDMLVNGRKICGILCEMESEADMAHFVIAGIGINVNLRELPHEIRGIATSLFLETGEEYSRSALLASFFNAFEPIYDAWLEEEDLGQVLECLDEYSYLKGRLVEVEQFNRRLRGRAAGISRTGELLLDLDNGERRVISSGEAHLFIEH